MSGNGAAVSKTKQKSEKTDSRLYFCTFLFSLLYLQSAPWLLIHTS